MYKNEDLPYKFIKNFYDDTNGKGGEQFNRIVSYEKKGSFYKVRYKNSPYWVHQDDPYRVEHILGEFNTIISGHKKGYKQTLQAKESFNYQIYHKVMVPRSTLLYKNSNKASPKIIDNKKLKTKEEYYYAYIKGHRWVNNKLWLKIRLYPELFNKTDHTDRELKNNKYYDAWIYPFSKKGRLEVSGHIIY